MDPQEIGRRIKQARERKGWTQLSFALDANVSPSSVARWEAGKLPPVRELLRIADLLEIDPEQLVEPAADHDAEVNLRLTAVEEELSDVHGLLRRIAEAVGAEEPPAADSQRGS